MNRDNNLDPFDEALLPLEEEVAQFDLHLHHPCCTATFFRPDLRGKTKTLWNRSAVRVFVRSFLDMGQYACKDKWEIEQAFWSHLKYLQLVFKQRGTSAEAKRQARRYANRAERKRLVSSGSSSVLNASETPLVVL